MYICCLLLIAALHVDADPIIYMLFGLPVECFNYSESQRSTNPGRLVAVATKCLYGDA